MLSVARNWLSISLMCCALSAVANRADAAEVTANFNTASNKIEASVELTELVTFDLQVSFENAVGLTADNFTITAELIHPNDAQLLSQLPNNLLVTLPALFPVRLSIEPDPNKGFAFSGTAEIEIYTKSLHYTQGTPLRLFHAHADEQFQDITTMTGSGSYRARGSAGQFSDFIIVADLRSAQAVITSKLNALTSFAQSASSHLSPAADLLLSDLVYDVESAMNNGNTRTALTALNTLIHTLEKDKGVLFPDVWRSSDDIVNVRGQMLSLSRTLRYSLRTF